MNNDGTWRSILIIKLITFSDWNSTSVIADWITDACESNELLLDSLKGSESNDDSPNEVLLDKEFKFFFLYNIKNLVVIIN
jgi:hypothetical protein